MKDAQLADFKLEILKSLKFNVPDKLVEFFRTHVVNDKSSKTSHKIQYWQ